MIKLTQPIWLNTSPIWQQSRQLYNTKLLSSTKVYRITGCFNIHRFLPSNNTKTIATHNTHLWYAPLHWPQILTMKCPVLPLVSMCALSHCGLMMPYGDKDDGTKPSPEDNRFVFSDFLFKEQQRLCILKLGHLRYLVVSCVWMVFQRVVCICCTTCAIITGQWYNRIIMGGTYHLIKY